MQKLQFFSILIILFVLYNQLLGQEVIEIQKLELSNEYLTITEKVEHINNQNIDEAIKLLSEFLLVTNNPYERFNIIFWELSFLYSKNNQYQKCYQILKQGQEEGLFYPIEIEKRKWPEYVDNLESIDNFNSFFERNNHLKQEAQKKAKFEYIVQLPENYTDEKEYPLLLVLHGGIGSHIGLSKYWYSRKLNSEYIVSFLQGINFRGTYLRSYQGNDLSNIVEAYNQIIHKYSVDTSKIILGGASAGGMRSVILTLDKLITAVGLILAFPVKPKNLEEQKLQDAANSGIRAVFLCGEKDWAIKQQKEMGYIFDKNNIANRFVVFSGIGHEYSIDFSKEIDLSLDYIFKRE